MSAQAQSGPDRIGKLIAALESMTDPQGRDCARQLVQEILDLHGAGLARMLDIVVDGSAVGKTTLNKLAVDENVCALLLLHGLHPHDLAARVRQAVDGLRATFGVQGVTLALAEVVDETVRLRLTGKWHGKHISPTQIRQEIEDAIFALAPEVADIEIDNLPDADVHEMKFVPASVLRGSHEGTSR